MNLSGLVLFIIGALLSAVVSVFFVPFIEQFGSRILGGFLPGGDSDLRGEWRSTYYYMSAGQQNVAVQYMRLTQLGRTVHGKNVGWAQKDDSDPTPHHKHEVRLTVEGDWATGEWHNRWPGARHHGVMQLRILPSGSMMQGRWIGFDSDAAIQEGDWTWERMP